MCYELYFKSRKAKEAQQPNTVASEVERVPAIVPAAEPQPVAQTKKPERIERELETTAA